MLTDLRDQLQRDLSAAFPERQGLTVGPLTSLSTGWESELYAFELSERVVGSDPPPPDGPRDAHTTPAAAGQTRSEALILRLHAGEAGPGKTTHEFAGLQLLARAGYPVPRPVHQAGPTSALGRPYMLIERIDGEPMWERLEQAQGAEAAALLGQFGELFLQLHQLEWRPFADHLDSAPARAWLAGASYAFVDAWLEEAGRILARSPGTGLEPIVDWLGERRDRVPCARPAVVHRDFHPNNILLRADGTGVVIDWTAWGVTDPRFDLAWTLLLARMFAGPGAREQFLAAYEQQAGAAVSEIEWFEVVACARRFHEVLATLAAGDAATGRRPGVQALMRQQLQALRPALDFMQAQTGLQLARVEALLRA